MMNPSILAKRPREQMLCGVFYAEEQNRYPTKEARRAQRKADQQGCTG
jgi:hypothetical protein